MGKNLKNADLVLRTGKVAFYLVPGNTAYTRMEGFTSLSTSKNPTEYERQYVDEDFKRTDITGYNVATAYALDRYKKHPVTDDIIMIHESELLGQDAVRSIIQVDMTTVTEGTNGTMTALGRMRDYAVIPDTDGDTTDCMTYSGNFKTRGEMEEVTVMSNDDFQTITVPSEAVAPVLKSLSLMRSGGTSLTTVPATFSGTTTSYTCAYTGSVNILATAESDSYIITAVCNGKSSSLNGTSATFTVAADDYIYVTVSRGGSGASSTRTYAIKFTSAS